MLEQPVPAASRLTYDGCYLDECHGLGPGGAPCVAGSNSTSVTYKNGKIYTNQNIVLLSFAIKLQWMISRMLKVK